MGIKTTQVHTDGKTGDPSMEVEGAEKYDRKNTCDSETTVVAE